MKDFKSNAAMTPEYKGAFHFDDVAAPFRILKKGCLQNLDFYFGLL